MRYLPLLLVSMTFVPGMAPSVLLAQQHNLQVFSPPVSGVYGQKGGDVALSAVRLHGSRVNVDGVDFNTDFISEASTCSYRSFIAGASLLGALGKDTFYLDGVKKNVVGGALHVGGSRHYLYSGSGYPRWVLFKGVIASFGNYSICRGAKEEGSFYNLLVGGAGRADF